MQAFGLISMEIMSQRITDSVFLQTKIFEDELVNAFKDVEYVRVLARYNPILNKLFVDRDDIDNCIVSRLALSQKSSS